jgi:hypothetical protein
LLIDHGDGARRLDELLPEAFGPISDRWKKRDPLHIRRPAAFRRSVGYQVKRDGDRLTVRQIDWVIDAYTHGDVATSRCRRC